jgi:hypothetical protein
MTDFLTRLAARGLGELRGIQPRPSSRFEPERQPLDEPALQEIEEFREAPRRGRPRVSDFAPRPESVDDTPRQSEPDHSSQASEPPHQPSGIEVDTERFEPADHQVSEPLPVESEVIRTTVVPESEELNWVPERRDASEAGRRDREDDGTSGRDQASSPSSYRKNDPRKLDRGVGELETDTEPVDAYAPIQSEVNWNWQSGHSEQAVAEPDVTSEAPIYRPAVQRYSADNRSEPLIDRDAPGTSPAVTISIGRVEVRTPQPQPVEPKPTPKPRYAPRLSLDVYLRRSRKGR